tara:strand:- start:162 stop:344 length:183 start_codon:yes stop_codon:yes gene_type:complete
MMEAILSEIQDKVWDIYKLAEEKGKRKKIRKELDELWDLIEVERKETSRNEFIQSVMEVK